MRLYLTVKLGENVYIYITLIEEYKKVNSKNLLKFNVKINKSFIEVQKSYNVFLTNKKIKTFNKPNIRIWKYLT